MTTSHTIIDTQMGDLTLVAAGGVLTGVYYPGHWTNPDRTASARAPTRASTRPSASSASTSRASARRSSCGRPPTGDTFQQRVWALLNRIPYGETTTYGELARELGDPALARMVGRAVGSNPLSVIVPCHRVVGKDGKLTGYAGGLERKRFLLELEGLPVAAEPARLF